MAKNLKNKFSLKDFKLKFCRDVKKTADYECAPYTMPTKEAKNDDSKLSANKLRTTDNKASYHDYEVANLTDSLAIYERGIYEKRTSSPNSYVNLNYSSPKIDSKHFLYVTESTKIYDAEDQNESIDHEIEFDRETLYVCSIACKAKIEGDLTLRFSDRVKLIHINKDFALVKNVLTNKCGYVPHNCIQTLDKFLEQVKFY